jgi:hypothetical protein
MKNEEIDGLVAHLRRKGNPHLFFEPPTNTAAL